MKELKRKRDAHNIFILIRLTQQTTFNSQSRDCVPLSRLMFWITMWVFFGFVATPG